MEVDDQLENVDFSSLKDQISQHTYNAIKRMDFKTMTKIQASTIPAGLEGKDIVGSAKTGKYECKCIK